MTRDEFNAWLEYHQAAFPGMADWIKKQDVDESAILRSWERVLYAVSIDDAKEATDTMQADLDQVPKYSRGYEAHPATVRRLAGKSYQARTGYQRKKNWFDDEESYKCKHCLDSAWVEIWGWSKLYARPKVCSIVCCCEAGQKVHHGTHAVFDPEKHRKYDPDTEDAHDPPADLMALNLGGHKRAE